MEDKCRNRAAKRETLRVKKRALRFISCGLLIQRCAYTTAPSITILCLQTEYTTNIPIAWYYRFDDYLASFICYIMLWRLFTCQNSIWMFIRVDFRRSWSMNKKKQEEKNVNLMTTIKPCLNPNNRPFFQTLLINLINHLSHALLVITVRHSNAE